MNRYFVVHGCIKSHWTVEFTATLCLKNFIGKNSWVRIRIRIRIRIGSAFFDPLDPDPDPDPHWAKRSDPDPDPQKNDADPNPWFLYKNVPCIVLLYITF